MKFKLLFFLNLIAVAAFSGNPHASTSVLAQGQWWKLAVQKAGIYRITYKDMVDMNLDPGNIDPAKIRLFGNGSGMLPETNSNPRIDDLREIPVKIISSEIDKLHPGDYVLFYGESPDLWSYGYSTGKFSHTKNLYSDSTYYYITIGTLPGKRIQTTASLDTTPNYYSQRFMDYLLYEKDSLNLIKSGKQWVGEVFDDNRSTFSFPFSFPDIDSNSVLRIVTNVVARAPVKSYFNLFLSGRFVDSIPIPSTDLIAQNIYAISNKKATYIVKPPSSGELTVKYDMPTPTSMGWLDFIEMSCQRNLSFTGRQMSFRDPSTLGPAKISEFTIRKTHPGVQIWDLTFPGDIREIVPLSIDSTLKFVIKTDTLREFVAFDSTGYYPVRIVGSVSNQNLHSLQPANLVIITHPDLYTEASRLADFHRQHDNISVLVASVSEIFNEFSCGQKDISAVRDFVKMLYDRGTSGNDVRYLLLFGDGTYDPKNRISPNNNFIPTFQSSESLRPLGSYVTDDFFGIMAHNGGAESNGNLALGVGRFPASTLDEAKAIVDKVIHYCSTSDSVMADWRNTFTFIADDENQNLHLHQAEQLELIVSRQYPVYNINKIYLDAYKMIQTPAGLRDPDVNVAINKAVAKGTLILNYTGHGGEDGWANEKVLTIADINNWQNKDKLPVFVTATCEFSRFDNPERNTGGEMVILNPDGGAVALYTTTRPAFSSSNFRLDTSFFNNLVSNDGNPRPRLGDLIKLSKNNNGNNTTIRNFLLLGDPAQIIAFPALQAKTTYINQQQHDSVPDTIFGLSKVTVRGEIEDRSGNKVTSFNGTLFPKVFDKPVTNRTLGNTSDSYPEDYQIQNSLLFSGRSSVKNGEFEFSFVVPKDISLHYGKGKISYYAQNGITDANGFDDTIVIGGTDPSINPQDPGPDIALYMDSTNFISGQRTTANPTLLANLEDPDGINAFYIGIGHEIVATLDGDNAHPIILNDYFQPSVDDYGSGTIQYQFTDLSTGFHTLSLKAWDLYDNSSTKGIRFLVFDQPVLSLSNLINIPNPLKDHTIFSFVPQQKSGDLDIQIQIFSYTGQLMKTIEETFPESSDTGISIPWDATSDNNQPLPDGLYIYRLNAKGSNGTFLSVSQKLIIRR